MHYEYAVEPAAIGSDWATFRFLIEKFGTDKGRLISRFPIKWEKKVIQAAKEAGVGDIKITSIIERLRDTKHKVADFGRPYDPEFSWIQNATHEHNRKAFRAVIYKDGTRPCAESLLFEDCSEETPLFATRTSQDIPRKSESIANALIVLATIADEIDIVDPYFDLRLARGNFTGPLRSLLAKIASTTTTPRVVRIHYRSHVSRPPASLLAQQAPGLVQGLLPQGYTLELFEWDQIAGGEDFHDRFFLTNIGGLMVGSGFSAVDANETAAFLLLDVEHARQLRSRFAPTATVYARVGPALRIDAGGNTVLF